MWCGSATAEPALRRPPKIPVDSRTRLAAVGDLKSLPNSVRHLFEPNNGFEFLPAPHATEWLAKHDEFGQTFEQFRRSKAPRPTPTRNVIYLLPLGEFGAPAPSVERLRQFTAAYFQLPARILEGIPLDPAQFGQRTNRHTKKPQIQTAPILERVSRQLPRDACCLLVITMWDLYPNDEWNYVFGEASLTKRVGVFSFARFDPDYLDEPRSDGFELDILRRSCRVLAHETCHMFGIQHCIYYRCVLNGVNHRDEMDKTPLHLCPVCLRKLHSAVGFDLIERDLQLADTFHEFGLSAESQWIKRRHQ